MLFESLFKQSGDPAKDLGNYLAAYDIVSTAHEPEYLAKISEKQKQTLKDIGFMESDGKFKRLILETIKHFYKIDGSDVVSAKPLFTISENNGNQPTP